MGDESQLIQRITRALPCREGVRAGRRGNGLGSPFGRHTGARLLLGIGDDAAIVAPAAAGGPRSNWILTCDAFLEGVHVLAGAHPPDSVGYKALVRATSDIAAMGGIPRFFLLTLALPASRTGVWLDRFLGGMARAARELRICLIGGDTTKNAAVTVSITVLGECGPGRDVTRSGARAGDLVYVSGRLGRAELGLDLFRRGLAGRAWAKPMVRHHLYPKARIELGAWLSANRVASAMMDLSDGLSTDLARLCAASRVGARLQAERIPQVRLPPHAAQHIERLKLNPQHMVLHGGDDYELLFTVRPQHVAALRRAPGFADLTAIGEITRGRHIVLADSSGRTKLLRPLGWDPFRRN